MTCDECEDQRPDAGVRSGATRVATSPRGRRVKALSEHTTVTFQSSFAEGLKGASVTRATSTGTAPSRTAPARPAFCSPVLTGFSTGLLAFAPAYAHA